MRVLLLFEWFDPEPTLKGLAFAKKLRDLGHDVEVLTSVPNYPGGRVYPGYSVKARQVEWMDGIRVTRVALFPSHDRSALRRILTYASFGATSCLAGLCFTPRPDVILANGPPPTVGVAAALIGLIRRVPFVFDVQDLWPDTLAATGMLTSPLALGLVGQVCAWMHRRAAHIVVLSPGMRLRLVERGVAPERVSTVYNWCGEASVGDEATEFGRRASRDGRFEVLFAGTMGRLQALDVVLDAAAILGQRDPRVRFSFLGDGIEAERLQDQARTRDLSNVVFLPRVPMSQVTPRLAEADALLVHLSDDPLFRITIPSKTQAYLAAGKPIIMAVGGDAARLVDESGAGVCAEPGNAASIAEAVLTLARMETDALREMGRRGRRYYRDRLSIDIGTRAISRVLECAVGGSRESA